MTWLLRRTRLNSLGNTGIGVPGKRSGRERIHWAIAAAALRLEISSLPSIPSTADTAVGETERPAGAHTPGSHAGGCMVRTLAEKWLHGGLPSADVRGDVAAAHPLPTQWEKKPLLRAAVQLSQIRGFRCL